MEFGTLVNALIVIAIVVAVIVRRLSWSELENSDADVWRGPVVMMGIGIYQMYHKHVTLDAAAIALLVASVAVALGAGYAAGRIAQVERRAGKGGKSAVFYRLGAAGLGIMVAYLVVRLGLTGLGHLLGATAAGGGSLLLTMGANLLTQSMVIQAKANRNIEEHAPR